MNRQTTNKREREREREREGEKERKRGRERAEKAERGKRLKQGTVYTFIIQTREHSREDSGTRALIHKKVRKVMKVHALEK